MLGGAVDLFRESLSCYQNGAYMASTLMCRRTTEAAVYLAASRKPSPSPGKLEIDFQRIREKWGPIRDRAEKLRLITQSDLLIMNEIRDRGNYTAHYGQRYDQRTQSDIATTMRLGFWADKKQTEDTLQKTAIVLGHIIERFLAQGSPKLLVHHRGEEEPRDLACRFQPV